MKALLPLLFSLSMLLGLPARAEQAGIGINSFKVVSTGEDEIRVEVDFTNDGSMGSLVAHGAAVLKDRLLPPSTYDRSPIPVGEHVKAVLTVGRPLGDGAQQTDLLRVILLAGSGPPLVERNFEYSYVWKEAKLPDPRSARAFIPTLPRGSRALPDLREINEGFEQRNFAALDAIYDRLNTSGNLDTDGRWMLSWFQYFLETQFNDKNFDCKELVRKWRAFNRKSQGAAIAEAMRLRMSAWSIRGYTANKDVDKFPMKLFKERLKESERTLIASRRYASNNPIWYQTYLAVASELGKDDQFLERLFAEGVGKYPTYLDLYVEMARHWSPTYGSANWKKVDRTAELAVTNTAAVSGTSNYTVIYVGITYRQLTGFEPFRDSLASWRKMRAGFEDLIKLNPTDVAFKNEFASYACRADDRETFLKAWAQIGKDLLREVWHSNYSPDLCEKRFTRDTN